MTRICLIQGHPDPAGGHFCHALAEAYAEGALGAGHTVSRIDTAALAPAPLESQAEFSAPPQGALLEAQERLREADHLVVVFPLWLGGMPARLKALFEQTARGGFMIGESDGGWPEQRLKGRTAHVVVTMGMPGIAYRVWFLNSGVAVLKRLILGMAGVSPVRQTTIGSVETLSDAARARRLSRLAEDGRRAR